MSESMVSSSKQSSTQLSTTSSSAATTISEVVSQQLFPALVAIDGPWPGSLSVMAWALEHLQVLALLISAVWGWSSTMRAIGQPLYFTLLPFWDYRYNPGVRVSGFTDFQIYFWIAFGYIAISTILVILHGWGQSTRSFTFATRISRVTVAATGSWLFLPLLHIMLAATVCHPDRSLNRLASFSDQQCYQGGAIATFICGVLSIFLLVAFRYVSQCMMIVDSPRSMLMTAKGSSGLDCATLLSHVCLGVLYHTLLPLNLHLAFAALVAVFYFALMLYTAINVPYITLGFNQVVCATFGVIIFTGLQLSVMYATPSTFLQSTTSAAGTRDIATSPFDAVVWFWGSVLFAFLGSKIAVIRISTHCLTAMNHVTEGLPYRDAEPFYPAGLPIDERTKLVEIEGYLFAQKRQEDLQAEVEKNMATSQESDALDQPVVLHALLDFVHQASDIEIATRFMPMYQAITRRQPTFEMVLFGLRICSKGLARFPSSIALNLHLAYYLASYVPSRTQDISALMSQFQRDDIADSGTSLTDALDLSLAYRVARRSGEVSGNLLLRDTSQKRVFVAAQRLHREALQNMGLFWGHLLDDHTDVSHLAGLAKTITDKREGGLGNYHRVAHDKADQSVLVRYAQFLEQVMLDAEGANQMRDYIVDVVEQIELNRGGESAARGFQHLIDRQLVKTSAQTSSISVLRNVLIVLFIVSALLVVGFIIFGALYTSQTADDIRRVYAAGTLRELTEQAGVLVDQLSHAIANVSSFAVSNPISVATMDVSVYNASMIQATLLTVASTFRQNHFDLAVGMYSEDSSAPVGAYNLAAHQELRGDAVETWTAGSFWTLGSVFSASLERIATMDLTGTTPTLGTFSSDIALVRANAIDPMAIAVNETVRLLVQESAARSIYAHFILTALAVGSLLACAATYTVLIFNFSSINSTKLSTLSLFTLIPKATVNRLRQQTQTMLENFDAPDASLEEKLLSKGLAGEEKERNALLASSARPTNKEAAKARADTLRQIDEENRRSSTDPHAPETSSSATSQRSFSAFKGANARRADGKILRTRSMTVAKEGDALASAAADSAVLLDDNALFDLENMAGLERQAQRDQSTWGNIESSDDRNAEIAVADLATDTHVGMRDAPTEGTGKSDSAQHLFAKGAIVAYFIVFAALAISLTVFLGVAGSSLVSLGNDAFKSLDAHSTLHSIGRHREEAFDAARSFVAHPADVSSYLHYLQAAQAENAQGAGFGRFVEDPDTLDVIYRSNSAWMEWLSVARLSASLSCSSVTAAAFTSNVPVQSPIAPDLLALWQSATGASSVFPATCVASGDGYLTPLVWNGTNSRVAAALQAELSSIVGTAAASTLVTGDAQSLVVLDVVTKLNLAVAIMASETVHKLEFVASRSLGDSSRRIWGTFSDFLNTSRDTVVGLASTGIAMAALAVAAWFFGAVNHSRIGIEFNLRNGIVAVILFGLAVIGIPGGAIAVTSANSIVHTATKQATMMQLANRSYSTVFQQRAQLYRAIMGNSHAGAAATDADLIMVRREAENALLDLGQHVDAERVDDLTNALSSLQKAFALSRVALSLAEPWTVPTTASVSARWNFTAELTGYTTALDFPDQVFYTDTYTDLALATRDRMRLAWNLVAGSYFDFLTIDVTNSIDKLRRSGKSVTDRNLSDTRAMGSTWIIATAICALLSVLATTVLAQSVAISLIASTKSSGNNAASTSSSTDAEGNDRNASQDELFDALSLRSRVALVVTLVAIGVVYIVGEVMLTRSRASTIDAASSRQYNVLRELAYVQISPAASAAFRAPIAAGLKTTYLAVDNLYFAGSTTGFNALGQWSDVDSALFGPSSATDSTHSCSISSVVYNYSQSAALGGGVDLAIRDWQYRVAAAALALQNTTEFAARILALQQDAPELLAAIRQTTDLIRDDSINDITTGKAVFLALAAVALLCVIIVFGVVFQPMLGELLHEEEGTKLMLKMIPEDVRQSVPAIAEYLRRGVILQDTKVQSINEAMTEMSTLPTIAIDFQGRILRFSKAAEDTFQYSKEEVLGKNVKILMPNAIAAEHDSYLDNYYRTGVKHVIGTNRRVRGQRKDGSVFPVEINVKQIKTGATTTFVGTLRDVAVDVEFERTTALSKAVSEVAPLPIIVINGKGIVVRFNRAAEKLFEYSENEVVGGNVSRLMNEADAERHDFYLERYRTTRVAKVVGKTRAVRCRKRTGAIFIGLLSVVELKQDNGNLFIGYCSDCTEKIETDIATTLGDAIATTAPVPLVAINPQGIVEAWNPAAARVFRVPASEIIGKNLKMIMPEAVAAKHDGYLQSYLRTGRKTMLDATTKAKGRRPAANSNGFELFPLTVSVTEVTRAGNMKSYVAYLNDQSRISEIALNSRIAASIREMSIVPIILIDIKGTIKGFTSAAEKLFGYMADEVMGKNVKMLMPKEIAVIHDNFLSKYAETGQKHVIGTTRRVTGMAKNGSPLPLELAIREATYQGESTFVGFVRSVAQEVKHRSENAVNDAVARLSTIPVIAIDERGTILTCSDSACTAFDWPRDELLGQNIKVLMPMAVAEKHDGYLQSYHERLQDHGVERARAESTILHKKRRIVAKTRDEMTFHAEIAVRDLHVPGLAPVFVGTIRNITQDLEQASQTTFAQTIIESSSIPFIAIDRLGTVSVFSSAAEREFGYTKAEVMGKNIKMLMPEEIALHHDGYLRAYAKTGIKSVIDRVRLVNGRTKEGVLFPLEISVRELIHTDLTGKKVSEYVGFLRSLKQERILQQASQINKVTAELVSTPVVMIDEIGTILDFNPAAQQVFGYSSAQALGQNVKILMPAAVAVHHDEYLSKYKQTGVKHVVDTTRILEAVKSDGSYFPAELSIREVKLPGRDEKQFLGYVRDLTETRQIEEQSKLNTAVIDLAPTALIVIDRVGTISVFSAAAERTFGFEASEVVGKNIKMLMPPDIAVHHDFYLKRYVDTGVKRVIDTTRYVTAQRKNGSRFAAQIMVVEIEVNGEVNYVGYVADDTERMLAEDETHMASFFAQTSTVPIISMDHLGKMISVSPSAEKVFGYTNAEMVGQNVKLLQPASVASKHDEYLANYLKTGIKSVIGAIRTVTARCKDGREIPVKIRVTELRSDANQPPTYIGYVWSIEEDIAIAQASIETTTLLQESPAPIIVITQMGLITDANPSACLAFGYTKEELMNKNVKMLTPPEIAANHDKFLERYRNTQEAHVIGTSRRLVALHRDGTLFPIQLYLREVKVQGLDTQYIGAFQLLAAQEEIEASARVAKAVLDMCTNGIIAMDAKGTVLRFSPAAENMTGYKENEVVGKNIKMLMPPHIAVNHDGYLETYAKTGVRHIVGSVRKVQAQHKSGRIFPVEVGVHELSLSTGKVFVGFLRTFGSGANVAMSAEINDIMLHLAVHTIIIMDDIGTVEVINKAGVKFFGLDDVSDVVGKNIKILMMEEVAAKHDDYLRTYRETGVRHVIGSTRRTAARHFKTGALLHIEISVRELPPSGDKGRRFMGYVRDIAEDLKLDVAVRTGNAMMHLSKYAIVVIDAIGTIVKFSRAAEELWRCKAEEAIGKNVKILMPERVAIHHDGYLDAYKRTGKKTVIDRAKDVLARRLSDGETIPVTLQVKEIKFEAKGLESVYVAFVEETSKTKRAPPTAARR